MTEAEQILVIFLSGALAVFLTLGIITLVLLIRLLKSINRLSEKAEQVGESVEASIRSISGIRIITSLVTALSSITKGKRR